MIRRLTTRSIAVIAILLPLLALFAYVALRSGPLAPAPVVLAEVRTSTLSPGLFGIGTVEARYTYRVGPTAAGRVVRVHANVGDAVVAGQLLAEIDPVDLDDRVRAQGGAVKRAKAQLVAAEAQAHDARDRLAYAETQAQRYEELLRARAVSVETRDAKSREFASAAAAFAAATANWDAAAEELARLDAEHSALVRQRANLRLVAPAPGIVVARNADAGTTVVAGQPVIEVVDPSQLWIHVRFDQATASGLAAGQQARIVMRSRPAATLAGRVLRVEPRADVVTEEMLAKIAFDAAPVPLPPIGELAEVSVELPALPVAPVIPNAAVRRVDGALGVWTVEQGKLKFVPVKLGATDLDGNVQVLAGLRGGEKLVVYSDHTLRGHSRIKIVAALPGVSS
jgi:RND family efflux transporter MFP subunit